MIKDIIQKYTSKRQDISIGLDIGSSSVKMVQLRAGDTPATRELAYFGVKEFKSQNHVDIVDAVKEVIALSPIPCTSANISVSGQSVIVRYLPMPKMSSEELKNAMSYQAAKYIPFNLEDVNYDFQILNQGKSDDKNMRVLLVAAKKEIIDERIAILKDVGLVPNVIDVDSFAIINSFQLGSQQNQGIIAIVDIGADITSTTILKDNLPYFNRDVPLGGNDLTKAIIEGFEIDQVAAEELKRNPQEKYADLINVISPVLDSICREIHLSFNYCESQLGGSVKIIYLTGGFAKFKGIDKILSSMLGIEVQIWDPTQIMPVNPEISKVDIAAVGPLLTVSVGLALRE